MGTCVLFAIADYRIDWIKAEKYNTVDRFGDAIS